MSEFVNKFRGNMHILIFKIENYIIKKMKCANIKLIILFINVYIIKCIVCAVPGCGESNTGCWKECNISGFCSGNFKRIYEEVPGYTVGCYCFRPFTDSELNKINADDCDSYINQCLKGENYYHSCISIKPTCDNKKNKEFCTKYKKLDYINNICNINLQNIRPY